MLIGIVFFLSGILKLIDPVGTSLIVDAYLDFFRLGFLHFGAKAVAIGLSFVETVTGAALITRTWRKFSSIVSLMLIAGFTLITLVLLIFNPDMECGCFGQAIHLTHLESFLKNIALCLLWTFAFIPFGSSLKGQKALRHGRLKILSFNIALAAILVFGIYSLRSLPVLDLAGYPAGTELSSDDDATLTFYDDSFEYRHDLLVDGKVMIISIYDPSELGDRRLAELSSLVEKASALQITPIVLVSSTQRSFAEIAGGLPVSSVAYSADRRTILSLNRSNGGVTYVDDGCIVRKWSVNRLPSQQTLARYVQSDAAELLMEHASRQSIRFQLGLFVLFAIMIFV